MRELVECREGRILAHGQVGDDALGVAVRWHVGRLLAIPRPRTGAAPFSCTSPFHGSSPARARITLGLAVAFDPGDADDLAAPDREADVVEACAPTGPGR